MPLAGVFNSKRQNPNSGFEQPLSSVTSLSEEIANSHGEDDWLSGGKFAALLGLLVFAQFPQVLLGLQTFVARDYGFFAYPLAHFQQQCFWRGELPSWNPYCNCGIPFLAQWNTMSLYPPALIYLLFPLTWSLSFFCLLHLFSGGMGMYFLARRVTRSRFGGAVGGMLFTFSGLSLNFLMWPSYIATYSWIPWVVLTAERGWREGGSKMVLGAVVGAFQMLAGGPEAIILTWLLLTVMWLGQAAVSFGGISGKKVGWAELWRFPAIVILVAGLCAVQLAPFIDLTVHSQRNAGYGGDRWAMPLRGWANFFVPMVFGRVWNIGVFYQHSQEWTSSYYLPIGGLVSAVTAVLTVRSRRVWVFAAAALAGLFLAFGQQTFVFRTLRWLVPQLSIITFPVKFITLLCFAVPILAAFYISNIRRDRMQDGSPTRSILVSGCLALATIFGILLWAWLKPMPQDNFPATLHNGIERMGFLIGEIGLVILWLRSRKIRLSRIISIALLVTFWLDALTHEPNQNPTVSPSIYEPGLVKARLDMKPQPMLGQSRVMLSSNLNRRFNVTLTSDLSTEFLIKRLGYYADCNLLDGVPKVNGFFPLYPVATGDIIRLLYGTTNAFPRLLDFLSVSHETKDSEAVEWTARGSWLPEITAGQRPVFLDKNGSISAISSDKFDPASIVVLPIEDEESTKVKNGAAARVSSAKVEQTSVNFDIDAEAQCIAVISQTYYHLWQATVDGNTTRLFRANLAFQALEVPAGHHHIEVKYRNRPLILGGLISATSLIICGVILVLNRAFQRQRN